MDVRKNQNLGFGSVMVKFKRADLTALKQTEVKALNKLIAKDALFGQVDTNIVHTGGTKNNQFGRYVGVNFKNDLIGAIYASDKPEKENKFVRLFIKLMKNVKYELTHIPNTSEYADKTKEVKHKLIADVMHSK